MTVTRRIAFSIVALAVLAPVVFTSPARAAQKVQAEEKVPYGTQPDSNETLTLNGTLPRGGHLIPGQTRPLDVTLTNTGYESATDVAIDVVLPNGLSVSTNDDQWKCGDVDSRDIARCRYSKTLNSESRVEVRLLVRALEVEAPVTEAITLMARTSAEKTTNTQVIPVSVNDVAHPVLVPHIRHRLAQSGKWERWESGLHEVHVNEQVTYRIVVVNEGHQALAKGTSVSIRQKVRQVDVKSVVSNTTNSDCSFDKNAISCEIEANEDVAPGKHVTSIDVTFVVNKPQDIMGFHDVKVTNNSTGGVHKIGMSVKALHRSNSLKIDVHHLIDPDAGGKAEISLRLHNLANGIPHDSFTVHAQLPKVFKFAEFSGKNWSCGQNGSFLTCTYSAPLKPEQKSKVARLTFNVSKKARTDGSSYEIDFRSLHAVSKVHFQVHERITAEAQASPTSLVTIANTKGNSVLLSAHDGEHNGKALRHTWKQRCTTAQDVKEFAGCKRGITPAVEIAHPRHVRTHVQLPDVDKETQFVFQYIAHTDSSEVRKTVRVTARPASDVVRASASVTSFSDVPTWLSDATSAAGVTLTNVVNANGTITADATLPKDMRTRLNVPDGISTRLTAYPEDQTRCAVISVGTPDSSTKAVNIKVTGLTAKTFEYVLAPTGCSFGGATYKQNALIIHGNVFDKEMTFTGPVSLTPVFKYIGTGTVVSLNLGAVEDSFRFDSVDLVLTLDDTVGTTKLAIAAKVALFDANLSISGSISAPVSPEGLYLDGMQAQLTLASPQTYTIGELKVKDLSISIGVRWTPALSATTSTSMVKNFYTTLTGTGTFEFLGTSLRVEQIEADFLGSRLNSILFKFKTDLNIPGMEKASGDLSIWWYAAQPAAPTTGDAAAATASAAASAKPYWAVDASMILEAEGGWAIGTEKRPARLSYRNECIAVQGQVIVPDIIDATVNGYMATGFPCTPAMMTFARPPSDEKSDSILEKLPMPAFRGDWRFDATDVRITLGDFKMMGDFSVGRIASLPFGAIDGNMRFTSSDTKNAIYLKGDLSPLTGAHLEGRGNLTVAGVTANFDVDAALDTKSQFVNASADMDFAGSKLELQGSFKIEEYNGMPYPTSSFSASYPSYSVEGFNLGRTTFSLEQAPRKASYVGTTSVQLGFLNFNGVLSMYGTTAGQVGMYMHVDGSLNVSDKWKANVSVSAGNCQSHKSLNPFKYEACAKLKSFEITANGSVVLQGRTFSMGDIKFDTGGHFTKYVSYSSKQCDTSGNIGGVQWQGCFSYSIDATLSDKSPYASFDADASVSIDSRVRNSIAHKWGKWDHWGTLKSGISISFDPFKLYIRVGSIKVSFSI